MSGTYEDICKEIEKFKSIPLSGEDIKRILNGKANVLKYGALAKYDNIDEVLHPYGAAVILIESEPNSGHWFCVFKRTGIVAEDEYPNMLEVFEPYGNEIDHFLKYIDPEFAVRSNQASKHLSRLLYDSDYDISYNQYPLQKEGKGINTCGRWCALRILLKDIPLDAFNDFFSGIENKDNVVSCITSDDRQLQ